MGSLIYLGIMIAFLFVVKAVLSRMEEMSEKRKKRAERRLILSRMEEMSEKRKKRAERRLKVRNYQTIDYTGFNPETGRYEN
jgi:hypothetical protein